jgi:hypothetical protein
VGKNFAPFLRLLLRSRATGADHAGVIRLFAPHLHILTSFDDYSHCILWRFDAGRLFYLLVSAGAFTSGTPVAGAKPS